MQCSFITFNSQPTQTFYTRHSTLLSILEFNIFFFLSKSILDLYFFLTGRGLKTFIIIFLQDKISEKAPFLSHRFDAATDKSEKDDTIGMEMRKRFVCFKHFVKSSKISFFSENNKAFLNIYNLFTP